MIGFEWAQNNLAVATPQELQGKGVNVYFAPSIRAEHKVVNLEVFVWPTRRTIETCRRG
ncbi:MAG: hypothetical protein HY329_12285 [Chloroflexi bacterium]|nr:hypothetical protein [Chloroflexota bacterium]